MYHQQKHLGTFHRESKQHSQYKPEAHTNCLQHLPGTFHREKRAGNIVNTSQKPIQHSPAPLTGPRCYTDASTTPDRAFSHPREARLGIFIINTGMHPAQSIYIKAAIAHSASVLMAEAAALALAAVLTERLHIQNTSFLSDNQELVNFLNSSDQSTPPDWRIKNLTHKFNDSTRQRNTRVFKIRRNLNLTAHTLAKQAFLDMQSHPPTLSVSCSNRNHVLQCPLMEALQTELLASVTILTARCF